MAADPDSVGRQGSASEFGLNAVRKIWNRRWQIWNVGFRLNGSDLFWQNPLANSFFFLDRTMNDSTTPLLSRTVVCRARAPLSPTQLPYHASASSLFSLTASVSDACFTQACLFSGWFRPDSAVSEAYSCGPRRTPCAANGVVTPPPGRRFRTSGCDSLQHHDILLWDPLLSSGARSVQPTFNFSSLQVTLIRFRGLDRFWCLIVCASLNLNSPVTHWYRISSI